MVDELQELAADYAASTGLSVLVCLDLLKHDIEPPMRWRVDHEGYRPAEIQAFLTEQKRRNSDRDDVEWEC